MNKTAREDKFCFCWWLVFLSMLSLLLPTLCFYGFLTDKTFYIIQFVIQIFLMIPAIIGLIPIIFKKETCELGFHKFPPVLVPIIIALPIFLQQFINIFMLPFNRILIFLFDTGTTDLLVKPDGVLNWILAILSICILAPVIEEILCRGILMHYLKPYGILVSLIVSALAFALLHFDPKTLIPIFFLGLLFGVIRLLTNSIWGAILAHSANNILAFILQMLPQTQQSANVILLTLSVILFPLLFVLLLKLSPKENREKIQIKPTKKMKLSVGAILCLSIYELYALLILIIKLSSFITGDSYLI